MTRLRLRRYALALCSVLLIPPLLWTGVVLIAPTGWAARQVTTALQAATKRSVRLEQLSVRWLGGVRLTNLEISAHSDGTDPWFKALHVELDMGLLDVFGGRLRPRKATATGVELRVLRHADGRLEIADLIKREEIHPIHPHTHHDADPLIVQIQGGNLAIIDEPSHTRLNIKDVDVEAIVEERKTAIPSLRGVLNGGPFQMVGELDRTGREPRFEARLQADDVVLDDGMCVLRYAIPVLAGTSLNLKGHLHADIYLHGEGATGEALSRSLAGHGIIAINPIDLDGAPLIAELSKVAEISQQGRLASIRSDFVIKDRRVTTDHFTLNVGRVPLTLAGWTNFDGRLDYRINLKGLTDRLPDKARRLLGDLNVDIGSMASVTLRGTVNEMLVQVNGVSLDRSLIKATRLKREDRDKLRILGRQFLDQLAR